ncbi:MAG: DNA repair protein RecN [Burkholderiaceae bacterium]
MLRGIGAKLIEIHGQHASQALLTPDGQRRMLDDYARTDEALQAVANEWKQLRDAQGALERAQSDQRALDLEREQLAWQLGELGPLQPVEGEWEQLGTEQRRLANSAALVEGASAAAQALAEADDSITDRLGQLAQRLRSLIRFDDSIAPILEMVDSASIQAAEAASELAAYARNVDLDAERLAQVERRISTLFDTARKLRLEPDALPDALARARSRMDDIEASRDAEALGRALTQARASYEAAARRLSASRRKAAKTLEKEVGTEIAGLGMAGGRFEIAFEVAEPGPSGTDRIEFRVAGHKGSEPRALGRVASGGELSRIALAITVSAARANPVPTVIFDEADTGVGGAVADSIGQLMRRLGGSCQVLSVTHLPQVAACAHHQLKVEKATDESGASSTIRTLDTEDRIEEIARMLGGSRVTATTRKHARELLQASATD